MNEIMTAIPGSDIEPVEGATKGDPSDANKTIRLSIYARRNPHAAAAREVRLRQLRSAPPKQRRYLKGDEFNALFGATQADFDAISNWAKGNGLKVLDTSIPMRRVTVEGTVAEVERAFSVKLSEYKHPQIGEFRGREGAIHVSPDLAGIVEGVFGLDERPLGKPFRKHSKGSFVSCSELKAKVRPDGRAVLAASSSQFPGAFFPPQVANLYNYPAKFDGTGQNIAIFAFNGPPSPDPRGGYSLSALRTYYEQVLGATTPAIENVVVAGPGNDPGPDTQASENQGDSTGEVMLDMCVVGSIAPGAKIFMYFTEFTAKGWVNAINQAITDENNISVISISYGNPESGAGTAWTHMGVQAVNKALEAAVAKGVTVCCSSGDSGSSDGLARPHVDFPASSPNVLGVGGTRLFAAPANAPTTITSEVVWNGLASSDGATGGGISTTFPKPSYQDLVQVPRSVVPPHLIGRGVPDVSAVGDPRSGVIVMHIDGQNLEQIGGTSVSTPLWASLVARLNQALGTPCGFLNTILYTKCATGVLRDITSGNNGAYAAKVGWDACTGLGSPNGQTLLAALSGSSLTQSTPAQAARLLRNVVRPRRVVALLATVKRPARVARILNHMARPARVARILHAMRLNRAALVLAAIRAQRPRRFKLVLIRMRAVRPARTGQIIMRMNKPVPGGR